MCLQSVEPHVRYVNLDNCRFVCVCGSSTEAVISRERLIDLKDRLGDVQAP
jgi:hypothetical protein